MMTYIMSKTDNIGKLYRASSLINRVINKLKYYFFKKKLSIGGINYGGG